MNGYFEHAGPFERRRLNRAILIVVAMTLAGIAFNDGVHALISAAEKSGPWLELLARRAEIAALADRLERK